jgi:hypothetical protein
MSLPDRGAAGWSLGKDMTVKTVTFQVSRGFGIGYSLHHFVWRSGYFCTRHTPNRSDDVVTF